ncbi:hypothetical protein RSSM_04692 [Rhodopirellula sallentina SM41]|uniref:Uncharacterized protein n=1 Tax=Rhodopirellula sallentina SM41 TaxID=1263870 RepID=M5UCY4_9BACT|nr:hypothetical protein RSSM_04692 [Rhodopirellula sallentina SM41]
MDATQASRPGTSADLDDHRDPATGSVATARAGPACRPAGTRTGA